MSRALKKYCYYNNNKFTVPFLDIDNDALTQDCCLHQLLDICAKNLLTVGENKFANNFVSHKGHLSSHTNLQNPPGYQLYVKEVAA